MSSTDCTLASWARPVFQSASNRSQTPVPSRSLHFSERVQLLQASFQEKRAKRLEMQHELEVIKLTPTKPPRPEDRLQPLQPRPAASYSVFAQRLRQNQENLAAVSRKYSQLYASSFAALRQRYRSPLVRPGEEASRSEVSGCDEAAARDAAEVARS